jgi:hypothetical protein
LWKATKKIKQVKRPSPSLRTSQGTWARSNVKKAHAFVEHLAKGFQLHSSENEPEEEEALILISLLPTVSKVFEKLLLRGSSQWLRITD